MNSGYQNSRTDKRNRPKNYLDLVSPATVAFKADHYISGDSWRCVWAIREYPPVTRELALLSGIGDREHVTLHIFTRPVSGPEQARILQNAERKGKLDAASGRLQDAVNGEENVRDLTALLSDRRQELGMLLHCAVYLELRAESYEKLKELQGDVLLELTRARIGVDRLTLRQKEGFLSVQPGGENAFGELFERILPSSAVANLYPFRYSGKTDPHGLYLGRDRYGTNLFCDLEQREGDKTNGNALLLGNSGQGKSYLLKLLLTNSREGGKKILVLDAEEEYRELAASVGGTYVDLMSGEYRINPLEPRSWAEDISAETESCPDAFRRKNRLAQHVAWLKDFFRSYRDFTDAQIDVIETLLVRLYAAYGMDFTTETWSKDPAKYPTLSDLYAIAKQEYESFSEGSRSLFSRELLRGVCLGLHTLCAGAESRFFDGITNLRGDRFVVFGVRGLLECGRHTKDAMLFNILSYMNHRLLTEGNTVAAIDELYLFLTNPIAIEYIRNASKRVRKKDSAVFLASQNIEDFLLPEVKQLTKPLFSIPTHQFLFYPGNVPVSEYRELLQLEPNEFERIRNPERGSCLYRCGSERYLLQVKAPAYKERMFGTAGGR